MGVRSTMEYVGYNPKEVSLYISALESGESTASELAERTDIPLTTAEEVLRRMRKHGLVSSYTKRNRMYWVAERPEKILAGLDEKRRAFESIVPKLVDRRAKRTTSLSIHTYSGMHEIRLIMDDIIEAKHEILAVMPWERWQEFLGADFLKDFIEQRRRHYLRLRLITEHSSASTDLRKRDAKELRHTRFLGDGESIGNVNFIYADKIAMISLDKKRPFGIILDDAAIAKTMKRGFEALWREAE